MVSEPNPDLWAGLFNEDTLVRAHGPNVLSPVFGSYPAARIHDYLKTGYQQVSVNSTLELASRSGVASAFPELVQAFGPSPGDVDLSSLPSERDMRSAIARRLFHSGIREAMDARSNQLVQLARQEAGHALSAGAPPEFIPIVPDAPDVVMDFAQLAVFHRQRSGTTSSLSLPQRDNERDFHQWLTALGNYPGLLRRLGLVIESGDRSERDSRASSRWAWPASSRAPVPRPARRRDAVAHASHGVQIRARTPVRGCVGANGRSAGGVRLGPAEPAGWRISRGWIQDHSAGHRWRRTSDARSDGPGFVASSQPRAARRA